MQWRNNLFIRIEKGMIGIEKTSGFYDEFLDSFETYIIGRMKTALIKQSQSCTILNLFWEGVDMNLNGAMILSGDWWIH